MVVARGGMEQSVPVGAPAAVHSGVEGAFAEDAAGDGVEAEAEQDLALLEDAAAAAVAAGREVSAAAGAAAGDESQVGQTVRCLAGRLQPQRKGWTRLWLKVAVAAGADGGPWWVESRAVSVCTRLGDA
ncbi:hypothetical protein EDD11_010358 [Mortierella claussenii]|nr:hypothetical protein EDD11_010358 [Mortierella claussenii]